MNKEYQKSKLVSLTTPAVPMWGIFFCEGAPDDLWVSPVVALAVIDDGIPGYDRIIRPLCYVQDTGVDDWYEAGDALGYLLGDEVSNAKEIFAAAIARRKRHGGRPGAQNLEKMCKPKWLRKL